MADIAFPAALASTLGAVLGRPVQPFSAIALAPLVAASVDIRHVRATTATITDQVVLKSGATELPFINGRVWLLRLADGYKAWEGWSDAAGYYTATGLEIGVEYVAMAIDPTRNHKTTGAGPVMAT